MGNGRSDPYSSPYNFPKLVSRSLPCLHSLSITSKYMKVGFHIHEANRVCKRLAHAKHTGQNFMMWLSYVQYARCTTIGAESQA